MFGKHTVLYDKLGSADTILNMEKYNGRVNIAQPTDPTAVFKMHERISAKNKSTTYCEALTGNLEWNVLAQVFFSKENIQIIQNGLRAGVYAMSEGKYIIPNQNIENLKIIMRSTYLQYAEHYPTKITQQVERLNNIVLDYAVPAVYGEAVGYSKYIEDQSTLVMPLNHPLNHDRNYKELELRRFL
jgi:hypothetical protein